MKWNRIAFVFTLTEIEPPQVIRVASVAIAGEEIQMSFENHCRVFGFARDTFRRVLFPSATC
jgi:hypothetical protein